MTPLETAITAIFNRYGVNVTKFIATEYSGGLVIDVETSYGTFCIEEENDRKGSFYIVGYPTISDDILKKIEVDLDGLYHP